MPLLCKVYIVLGQGDVPLSRISKADIPLLRQSVVKMRKSPMSCGLDTYDLRVTKGGAISRFVSSRKAEQTRKFLTILPHTTGFSADFFGQDIRLLAVHIIVSIKIISEIIAVGI